MQCWVKVVRVGTPVSFLILEEQLPVLHHGDDDTFGFGIGGFILSKHFPSTPIYWGIFHHTWMFYLVKCFFWICWDNCIVYFFTLLMWCAALIGLQRWSQPCTTGIRPTWWWSIYLLMQCRIWFAYNFGVDFCIEVHQRSWPIIFFWCVIFLPGFNIRVALDWLNELESTAFTSICWKSLRIRIPSPLNVL